MRSITALFLVGLAACGSPAFKAAQQDGSARAYEQFAADNPTDARAGTAMSRAEALRWENAQQKQTAAAWSTYLRNHPTAKRAPEARSALDDAAYNEALQDKDALALERYLTSFSDGAHRKEAREHLDAVRWHDAKSDDTHVSYRRYILQEPDGANLDKAKERYHERIWERALRLDTLRAYRLYLSEFPEGSHVDEGRARIAELQLTKVEIVVALRESWQTDRRAALAALVKESGTFAPKLKSIGYEVVGPVRSVDLGPGGDPASVLKNQPGIGTVLVLVDDAQGEPFKPSGHRTNISGSVEVYSSARAEPMARWPVAGSTGSTIYAIDVFGLYRSAAETAMADAWGQLGRMIEFHPNPR